MRFAVLALVPSLALAACSSAQPPAPAPDGVDHEAVASQAAELSGPVTRSQVIANAELWVAAKLQYCQSPYGQPDPDTSCSHICNRESNPQWNPYRSDCSGFVSWAWELPSPGLVTSEFAPYATSASNEIQCVDMLPGDAANKNPSGHIVIFKEWITPGKEAVFIEEPGCSSSTPYAHEFQSAVTCNGSSMTIAYEGETFDAIRYVHIVDDPVDAGAHDSGSTGTDSGGTHEDAGTGSGSGSGGGESDAGKGGKGGSSSGSHGSSGGSGSSSGGGSSGGGAASGGGSSGSAESDAGGGPFGDAGGSAGCDVAPGSHGGSAAGLVLGLGLVLARRRRRT